MKLFEDEFIIHLGVNGGQQRDWIKAPTGGQAENIMKARYPDAHVTLFKIQEVEDRD